MIPPGNGLEAGMGLACQEEGGSCVEVADSSPQQGTDVTVFLKAGHLAQKGDNVTQEQRYGQVHPEGWRVQKFTYV